MFCRYCGAEIPSDAKFCEKCGSAVEHSSPDRSGPPVAAQPLPDEPPTQAKKKKKRVWIAAAAVAAIMIIAGSLAALFLILGNNESTGDHDVPSTGPYVSAAPPEETESSAPTEEVSAPVPAETAEPEHRYAFVVDGCTWTEAQNKAIEAGGRLACFETREEYERVLRELDNDNNRSIAYRIGARRETGGTKYYWTDGADRLYGECLNDDGSYAFELWLPGEPSYHLEERSEQYLTIYYDADLDAWVWSDVADAVYGHDMTKYGYIIEYLDGVELQIPEASFAAEPMNSGDPAGDGEPADDM